MPGNVTAPNAGSPTRVLPAALCDAFSESRRWDGVINEYTDGRAQRSVFASASRRSWQQARYLTEAEADDLRAKFEAWRDDAFYFYDIDGLFDATGIATAGRRLVVFDGGLSETLAMGSRGSAIRLREVA